MSDNLPSAAIQQFDISCSLNSIVMLALLTGIFTMVYIGTMYLYLNGKGSRQRMVIATTTALTFLGIFQLGLQWYYLKRAVVTNGTIRNDIFVALLEIPAWLDVLLCFSQMLVVVFADALLIWRCFFVWNRSRRVILLPTLLLVAEFLLTFAHLTLLSLTDTEKITSKDVRLLGHIQVAMLCASFTGSMAATLLIAYKIHSVTNQEFTPRGRFRHVIEIIVQSAVVYSLALLLQLAYNVRAVIATDLEQLAFAFSSYAQPLAFSLTVLVPTIMVARVCLAPDPNVHLSGQLHLSRLQFQEPSGSSENGQVRTDGAGEMQVKSLLPSTGEKDAV
ncbi:hypothetical protein GALMADRAFT_143712 [Galerina marginata CBS 339.88]|uniref:Uncharacterized protein n=1 Tax=Galerina marginata (strain CBS 339.88) TaxID=685588 RepID=A0A067SKK2_GALM3|nr:hypothetical protein GALMADRAFT_143712 [Galerina marginata CBS 339.88]